MENDIDELKKKLVNACRILVNEGMTEGAYCVSCRLDPKHMLINEDISPCLVTEERVQLLSLDELPAEGKAHPAIYRARADVNAVVHAHPIHAIALGAVAEEITPIHHYGVIFPGKIKVYKSVGQVKTTQRAAEIAELLGDGRAILQRGHGTLVVGKDLEEAVLGTLFLEETAKLQFLAKLMGTPDYVPAELYPKISTQIFNEKSKKRMWDHYVAKLKWRNW